MKKIIILVLAVSLTAIAANAQTQHPVTTSAPVSVTVGPEYLSGAIAIPVLKNSVYAGVGILPLTTIGSLFVNLFTSGFTALGGYSLNRDYKSNVTPLSYFAGYERNLTKMFQLGASFTYAADSYGYQPNRLNTDPNAQNMILTTSWSTLMLTAKCSWVNNPAFRFYSRIGVGLCVIGASIKYVDGTKPATSYIPFPFFGAQVSPLGFEFGRSFSFFVEPISVGWQSIFITAGLKYNF